MVRKKRSKIPYVIMIVEIILIAGLLLYILPYRYSLNATEHYTESDELLQNPLTGFAPNAEHEEECKDTELVYIGLTWAEWEPREGVFDIEGLEEKYHIQQWKAENKHAVLRFMCDVPGDEKHLDIPMWLYQKTRDGAYYESEYGSGYSPDYSNEVFLDAHGKAIQALAEYCNKDSFVAYVELGSLGHWGEWHTNKEAGVPGMPDANICWNYVLDYSDQFHNVNLLMRRNYVMVAEAGLGLYNDMTGDKKDTEEWLGWIKEGGYYDTEGDALEYIPLGKFWETGPVGGELTSKYAMEDMLDKNLQTTLGLVERSHMTFIGPNCPTGKLAESSGAEALLKRMGYRYYISQLDTRFAFGENRLEVRLTWKNTGLAPMYWDWPVTMYVFDMNGEIKYWETVDIKLSELVPDKAVETINHIPFTDLIRQGFRIGIGITDPELKEHIKLAMDVEMKDNIQILYTYDK